MKTARQLTDQVPVRRMCQVLDVARSSFYRVRNPRLPKVSRPRPLSARALTTAEQTKVRDTLNSERFADKSPYQVYATLLDDDQAYLCSKEAYYT